MAYNVFHAIQLAPIREPNAQLHERIPLQISHRRFVHVEPLQLDPEPLIIMLAHALMRALTARPSRCARLRATRPAFKDKSTAADLKCPVSLQPLLST
jgi:hypothetical protein